MRNLTTTIMRAGGATLLALLLLATPAAADDDELGAYLREGTCEEPGTVIDDIGDLEPRDDDDNVWRLIGNAEPEPDVVYGEDEDVDGTIDELTGVDRVITIHATDDEDADIIACGAIAGAPDADGTLLIELDEVDDSGFQGRAHLAPDRDDDETEITIGVWQAEADTRGV